MIGFLSGLIGSAIYNLMAGWVGGIEIELESGPGSAGTASPAAPGSYYSQA